MSMDWIFRLEVRVVWRLLLDDDAFIHNDDNKIDEKDGDEQAVVFDLPKRELVVEQGEQEGRRAGAEGGCQQVAEWKAAFTTEDQRQNDENDGAEENRLEI